MALRRPPLRTSVRSGRAAGGELAQAPELRERGVRHGAVRGGGEVEGVPIDEEVRGTLAEAARRDVRHLRHRAPVVAEELRQAARVPRGEVDLVVVRQEVER